MTERTSRTTVVFRSPARIAGVEAALPAGSYVVETVEEQIAGISFVAYRRLQTTIEIPIFGSVLSGRQVICIDPHDLQAARDRDSKL